MARFRVSDGIDNYLSQLQHCADKTEDIIKRSAWEGARVVMDAVKAEANTIPIHESNKFGGIRDGKVTGAGLDNVSGLTISQKAGVIESLGISRFREDGNFINVKIGSDGYNSIKTEKYPKGQPNAMLVRSLEPGTSFRAAYPFVSRAVSKSRSKCIEAMRKQCDTEIKKYIKA